MTGMLLRDLEAAIWGNSKMRGGLLRSVSPEAPLVTLEREEKG